MTTTVVITGEVTEEVSEVVMVMTEASLIWEEL